MTMQFTNDNRGVSEVIGAILVFGLLIALMAIIQTQAVPAANEQVEFNHNQDVQSDMMKFKETSSRTISQGTTESTQVRMGTSYPSRLLFFNPPQPGGTIRTAGSGGAGVHNLSSPNADVELYLNQSDRSVFGPDTQRLEYEPDYNEFRNSPTTVLEYGGLYRVHGEGQVSIEDNTDIINGNTIDLTYFSGDLSRTSSRSLSLESQPTSAPARTVNVRGHEDDNITLTLPTRLSQSDWNKTLDEEPNVHDFNVSNGEITIELKDKSYQLRMAEVGVGRAVESPGPEYITKGSTHTLEIEDAQQLPIEVRDKYNNPVSGVEVNVSVSSGNISSDGNPQEATAVTDSQGRPQLVFEPEKPGRVIVNASFQTSQFGDSSKFKPNENMADTQFSIAVQQLLDQNRPAIDDFSVIDSGCGVGLEAIGLQLGDNECGFTIGVEISDSDHDLDTVEGRMIHSSERMVVDSTVLEAKRSSESPYDYEISLVDSDTTIFENNVYDIRLITNDRTGLSDSAIKTNREP